MINSYLPLDKTVKSEDVWASFTLDTQDAIQKLAREHGSQKPINQATLDHISEVNKTIDDLRKRFPISWRFFVRYSEIQLVLYSMKVKIGPRDCLSMDFETPKE